jgi:very-short-patch-repair endonuclease
MKIKLKDLPVNIRNKIKSDHPEIGLSEKKDNLKMQRKLFSYLSELYGEEIGWEISDVVPSRKFRIDIGFPAIKLAVEVVGFQYHSKHLASSKNGYYRNNILVANGWTFVYIPAGDINGRIDFCLKQVVDAYLCLSGKR